MRTTLGWLGWILFVGALILVQFGEKRRLHLNYYCTYLLLSDEIRDVQKQNFQRWIKANKATTAEELALSAFNAMDGAADKLAAGEPERPGASTIWGAEAMIWDYKVNVSAPLHH